MSRSAERWLSFGIMVRSRLYGARACRDGPVAAGLVVESQRGYVEDANLHHGAYPVWVMRSTALDVLNAVPATARQPMKLCASESVSNWVRRFLRLIRTPRLRAATPDDATRLYEWAMDAEVRRQSLRSKGFSWEAHLAWLAGKLADPGCRLFIAEWKSEPCGMIRFERLPAGDWRISYLIAPNFRGRGLAHGLVGRGMKAMAGEVVVAQVLPGNTASLQVFRSAKWREAVVDGVHEFRNITE